MPATIFQESDGKENIHGNVEYIMDDPKVV